MTSSIILRQSISKIGTGSHVKDNHEWRFRINLKGKNRRVIDFAVSSTIIILRF
jgi:hypothetical protein